MKTKIIPGNNDLILVIGEANLPKCNSTIIQITDFDWNDDLTPWPMQRLYKKEKDFGGKAERLLQFIRELPLSDYAHVFICGYSLAGLFALYACIQLDLNGCICCSSSFWYTDFVSFVQNSHIKNKVIYLSVGDKESHCKNSVLSLVGKCTEDIYDCLKQNNVCVLEWNPGNHFTDVDHRVEKGIVWLENHKIV